MVHLKEGKYYLTYGREVVGPMKPHRSSNKVFYGVVVKGEARVNRIYSIDSGLRHMLSYIRNDPTHIQFELEHYDRVTGFYSYSVPNEVVKGAKSSLRQSIPIKDHSMAVPVKIDDPITPYFVRRDMDGWDLERFRAAVAGM